MVYLYASSFLPATVLAFGWIGLAFGGKGDFRQITLWPALILSSISAGFGVWGFLHIAMLRQRSFFDYAVERRAMNYSVVAFIAAVVWLVRSRTFYSWTVLATSFTMTVSWMLALATL